ncbi:MAG: hypothetical protein IT226_00285 [Flavobacteriales bacterium]|nr:hypothetical protein [Flavobacteriales bacterium]
MRTARAGLTGLRPTDKVAKALLLETKMTGNPDFPSPSPTLVELKAGRETLEAAIVEAAGGDHANVFLRNVAEAELDKLIVRLAMDVSQTANGDAAKILSTGFELRKEGDPIGPLPGPSDLRARTGLLPGTVDLRWKPEYGAYYYQVELSITDPNEGGSWTLAGMTSKASFAGTGLAPATHVWYRVSCLGAGGYVSPYSDPAKGFAAPKQ